MRLRKREGEAEPEAGEAEGEVRGGQGSGNARERQGTSGWAGDAHDGCRASLSQIEGRLRWTVSQMEKRNSLQLYCNKLMLDFIKLSYMNMPCDWVVFCQLLGTVRAT